MATDTMERMADYGKMGSMDKGFSIPETKGLIGLDAVPMNSKGSDIVLQVAKVCAIVCYDMSILEEIYY